ncbi:hypothetical protein ABZ897_15095 [Nonomuraea sp. NPDC046802]|uniref:hypothetical protein n=1 Tax=Nonomuraea sp. NPDC046802 TaxID=3154919 RepID=UPI0033FF867B
MQPTHPQAQQQRNNTALIVTLVAGIVVLLLGAGGIGAYVYLSQPGPAPTLALQSTVPTEPPSAFPSNPPSTPPSDPATTAPPSYEPSPTPTSPRPSTSSRVEAGSPLTHTEFKDWNFSLGGVKLSADKVAGWTYNSCDPVDAEGLLADNNCERAVQIAYSAKSGHVKALQIMAAFPSEQDAKNTAARLLKLRSDRAVTWKRDYAHRGYAYGKILSSYMKKYVVITIVTTDKKGEADAKKFHAYLQSDHAAYFIWRDLTVTS